MRNYEPYSYDGEASRSAYAKRSCLLFTVADIFANLIDVLSARALANLFAHIDHSFEYDLYVPSHMVGMGNGCG